MTAAHEAEWSNGITFRWEGPADNGTLLVFQGDEEVERFEGVNMEAPCGICGAAIEGEGQLRIVNDEPRIVCGHHDAP